MVRGTSLKILGLVTSDAGIYQCIATNTAGTVQAAAQLRVDTKGQTGCKTSAQIFFKVKFWLISRVQYLEIKWANYLLDQWIFIHFSRLLTLRWFCVILMGIPFS